jgi:hypothetical protein
LESDEITSRSKPLSLATSGQRAPTFGLVLIVLLVDFFFFLLSSTLYFLFRHFLLLVVTFLLR